MISLETPVMPRNMGVSNASGRSVITDEHVAYAFPGGKLQAGILNISK